MVDGIHQKLHFPIFQQKTGIRDQCCPDHILHKHSPRPCSRGFRSSALNNGTTAGVISHVQSAVDVHGIAGDVIGEVAGVEEDGVGNVLGGAVAAQGDVGLGVHLGPGEGLAHGGQDIAGAHRVGRDVVRRAPQGKAFAQV